MSTKDKVVKAGQNAGEKATDKKENFIRVVTPRVNKAVKAINLVGLCASNNYVYTPEQSKAVVLALKTAVETVEKLFSGEKIAVGGFSLPS